MNKHRNFAKQTAAEWKARGFKSSKTDPSSEVAEDNAFERAETETQRPKKQIKKNKNSESVECTQLPDTTVKKLVARTEITTERPKKKVKPYTTPADSTEPSSSPKKKKVKKPDDGVEEGAEQGEKPKSNPQPKRQKQKFKGSYCLFVGNLNFETTKEEIIKHFSKAGTIKDVRIPVGKEDNKPRGIAYLDLEDHVTYENCLSLHHTFLSRRRINVETTFGGSGKSKKRMALIKEKTLKLRFLQREGYISSAKAKPWGKYTKDVPV